MLILALVLSWLPVTLDCRGGPESGVVYEVSYLWRECPGYMLDEPPPCGTFTVRRMQEEARFETAIGNADPQVGAGYWYEIRARDGAGNWSGGPCL